MSIASQYDVEAIKARNEYLENQLELVKNIINDTNLSRRERIEKVRGVLGR